MCAAVAGFTEAVRDGLATLAYRLKQSLTRCDSLMQAALICLKVKNSTILFRFARK